MYYVLEHWVFFIFTISCFKYFKLFMIFLTFYLLISFPYFQECKYIFFSIYQFCSTKKDSSTIDDKVAFVYTLCTAVILRYKCQLSFCIINNSDYFRTKCLFFCKISAILCVLFYLILENMSTNVRKFRFSLLYLTLVTSCIIDPFLCCHLFLLLPRF